MPVHQTIDSVEATVKAIDDMLIAIDGAPTQWAVIGYKAAIRRLGRQIAETADVKTMRAVLDKAATTSAHRAVILDAWDGIPGWHLGAVA